MIDEFIPIDSKCKLQAGDLVQLVPIKYNEADKGSLLLSSGIRLILSYDVNLDRAKIVTGPLLCLRHFDESCMLLFLFEGKKVVYDYYHISRLFYKPDLSYKIVAAF